MKQSVVECGQLVIVKGIESGQFRKYRITRDALDGKTSIEPETQIASMSSPIGTALLGKQIGSIVKIRTPKGPITVEILGVDAGASGALQTALECERDGRHADAASHFEQIGNYASAGRRHAIAQSIPDAARCFCLAGLYEEAAAYYDQLDDAAHAAQCYEEAGQNATAAVRYERAHEHLSAARCFERSGDISAAAPLYEASGEHAAAGRCHEKAGRSSDSARCYERVAEHHLAALHFEKSGDIEKAIFSFQKAGDWLRAAQLLEESKRFEPAAVCYATADCESESLRCRGRCHEATGEWIEAARCYDEAASVEWWESTKIENLLDAARCYDQLGLNEQANACRARARPDVPPETVESAE